jgi:hypothetical protein
MNTEITLEDLPKVLEYIHNCMMTFKMWEARMKEHITNPTKPLDLKKLDNNYNNVMKALVKCFDFIQECDHILHDQKHILLFGVIYASTEKLNSQDPKVITAVEKYKKWYTIRD